MPPINSAHAPQGAPVSMLGAPALQGAPAPWAEDCPRQSHKQAGHFVVFFKDQSIYRQYFTAVSENILEI